MTSNENDSNPSQILAALAVGLGVGFSLGILFAPNSGRKTRSLIAKSADRRLDDIRDKVDEIKDKVDDIRNSASDLFDKGMEHVQAHKENVVRGLDQVKKTYREVAG